jgi:hypothetical protein
MNNYKILLSLWLIAFIVFGIVAIRDLLFGNIIMGCIAILFCLACYAMMLNKIIEKKIRSGGKK